MVEEMRVLTVRQPWAWALVNGIKDVENRPFPARWSGLLAIHAGLIVDPKAHGFAPPVDTLTKGAIVGVVEVIGSTKDSKSPWVDKSYGEHAWLLDNARPIAEPIPMRGALGIRVLDSETASRIRAHREAVES